MNKHLIVHVFAVVQSLEKCISLSKEVIDGNKSLPAQIAKNIAEQERIVRKMRRTANRLQFEFANENWIESTRLLQVFYGLNHMVRPEVRTTYQSLALGKNVLSTTEQAVAVH